MLERKSVITKKEKYAKNRKTWILCTYKKAIRFRCDLVIFKTFFLEFYFQRKFQLFFFWRAFLFFFLFLSRGYQLFISVATTWKYFNPLSLLIALQDKWNNSHSHNPILLPIFSSVLIFYLKISRYSKMPFPFRISIIKEIRNASSNGKDTLIEPDR